MRYENRGDSEYYSSDYEYRIPPDEMKYTDNEFHAERRPGAVNEAEDKQSLRKRMRRFGFLMSTLTVAACTIVISGGAPKQEELPPQETAVAVTVAAEPAAPSKAETAAETQAVAVERLVLTESERAYLDSLSEALADRDYERTKALISDPQMEVIGIERFGGECYVYADGQCYPRNEFTGLGLWLVCEDEYDGPRAGWVQGNHGVAEGEGVSMSGSFDKVRPIYQWYEGPFEDGVAQGQGRIIWEQFEDSALYVRDESEGSFEGGIMVSGTVYSTLFESLGKTWSNLTVQNGEIIYAEDHLPDGQIMINNYGDDTEYVQDPVYIY